MVSTVYSIGGTKYTMIFYVYLLQSPYLQDNYVSRPDFRMC